MPGAVIVEDVRRESRAEGAGISARVRIESDLENPPALPDRTWVRVPAAYGDWLAEDADAFVPTAYLLASRLRLSLRVPDGISRRLLEALPAIGELFEEWCADQPKKYVAPPVESAPVVRTPSGTQAVAFFSGGVDSMFTLAQNLRRFGPSDSRALRALLLVHGFDISLDDRTRFDATLEALRPLAARRHLPLIPVTTNLQLLVAHDDWGRYAHGPALAQVALALGGGVHTVFVASTAPYTRLKPNGSHPALDQLWSSERVEIVHDGAELSRFQKIGRLTADRDLLDSLRVCWKNVGDAYNCGRCEKCLRTMVGLTLFGIPEGAAPFPPLEHGVLDRLTIPSNVQYHWREMLRWCTKHPAEPPLVASLERIVARQDRPPRDERDSRALGWIDAVARRAGWIRRAGAAADRLVFAGRFRRALWERHTREVVKERAALHPHELPGRRRS